MTAAAVLATTVVVLEPLAAIGANPPQPPVVQAPVQITTVQSGTGINVCKSATCDQRVDVINISIVTVLIGGAAVAHPRISLRPDALRFGRHTVGISSAALDVSLVESAGVPAVITDVSVAGADAADFAIEPSGCMRGAAAVAVLLAHARCRIAVVFRPSSVGARTAWLTVTVDGRRYAASVSGAGTAASPAAAPAVSTRISATPRRAAPAAHPPAAAPALASRPQTGVAAASVALLGAPAAASAPRLPAGALPRRSGPLAGPDAQPATRPQPISVPLTGGSAAVTDVAVAGGGAAGDPLLWTALVLLACFGLAFAALTRARAPRVDQGLLVLDDALLPAQHTQVVIHRDPSLSGR